MGLPKKLDYENSWCTLYVNKYEYTMDQELSHIQTANDGHTRSMG